MLHKAAHSFSPFKLQHLHSHIRSALNLNLGQNAGQNFNQASSSASASAASSSSSSALGGPAAQAGGAGGNAKYHAGRSYSHYYFYNRTTTPAANAASGNDGPSIQKQLADDEEESSKVLSHTSRNLRWRSGRRFAGRQRSSSLSNPGLTSGLPLDSSSSPTSHDTSNLPRSSPYSFNQAQLQARYRHAFSQAKRPSHERLLTLQPESSISAKRTISTTSASRKTTSELPLPSIVEIPKTAPSSPRISSRSLPLQQARRNSTSTATQRPPAISDDVINAASTLTEPAQKTISPEQPLESANTFESTSSATGNAPAIEQEDDTFVSFTNEDVANAQLQPTEEEKEFQKILSQLSKYQEIAQIRSLLRDYRMDKTNWTSTKHKHVIRTLFALRSYANTNDEIITFYNDFFENDMVPSLPVVSTAIRAYIERSQASYEQLKKAQLKNNAIKLAPAVENWLQGAPLPSQNQTSTSVELQSELVLDSTLATLQQQSDEDYAAARRILTGLGEELDYLTAYTLNGILAAAAFRGDIDTALIAFGALEGDPRTQRSLVSHETFKNLILAYGRGGDSRGLETIVETYMNRSPGTYQQSSSARRRMRKSKSAINLLESEEATSASEKEAADDVIQETGSFKAIQASEIDVCNAAILAYLLVGDGIKALDVLENMMTQKNSKLPSPNTLTLLNLIQGFAESGDLDSAFRWSNRIHAVPTPEDLPKPPTLEDTFNVIIATTSDISAIQEAAGKTPMLPQLGEYIRSIVSAGQSSTTTSQDAPLSPASSGGNVTDLGSIFSDPAMSRTTMSITPPPYIYQSPEDSVHIDHRLSSTVDDKTRMVRKNAEDVKWLSKLINDNIEKGIYAHPETLARAALAIGEKKGDPAELENIYKWANKALSGLEDPSDQAAAWAYIEDRMLMARARRGELIKAAMHRDRILAAGAAPSADAYAVMITNAKDTTDDATVALDLFEEARRFGVVPNLYLFNILISKLSKARRTQLALSYFEQMKAVGIRPSAVTYGSVIAACCRTGDEKAATFLFNEMVRSPGYRPRVPPYNTMMQFFITTKPDREKALKYFDAMLRAGVQPTEHTYKLLLDAYGTLEPVDLDSVKDVFSRLISDSNIKAANGGHWASLIHVYGSVKKDLGKTLEIFDSIATHPASVDSVHPLPDVICYEALFNALIAMERVDLVEKYLARMQGQFVQPTAYIWNVIIRAYTVTGDIEKAREAFGALADPPSGVAAAGNHSKEKTEDLPIEASPDPDAAAGNAPVYREPSTYEAMIKAEMSVGDPAKAQELLQRAVARAFPAAIINKLERMTKGEDVGSPAFAPSTTQAVGA